MSDENNLNPETELKLRKFIGRYLLGVAGFIGVANVLALFGALYFLVGEAARQAVTREVGDLGIKEQLSARLLELGGAQAQIDDVQKQVVGLSEEARTLRKNLDSVLNTDAAVIGEAARIIEITNSNPDFVSIAQAADVRIEASGGGRLRAFVGKTCSSDTSWQRCTKACGSLASIGGEIEISIDEANFTEAPTIFISQSGSGAWTTKGLHAVYDVSPTSFKLFAYNEHIGSRSYSSYANDPKNGQCLSWLALGR